MTILLTTLAGAPGARASVVQPTNTLTREEQPAQTDQGPPEDILIRKAILFGFPVAAFAGLIVALIATRKQRRQRRR